MICCIAPVSLPPVSILAFARQVVMWTGVDVLLGGVGLCGSPRGPAVASVALCCPYQQMHLQSVLSAAAFDSIVGRPWMEAMGLSCSLPGVTVLAVLRRPLGHSHTRVLAAHWAVGDWPCMCLAWEICVHQPVIAPGSAVL